MDIGDGWVTRKHWDHSLCEICFKYLVALGQTLNFDTPNNYKALRVNDIYDAKTLKKLISLEASFNRSLKDRGYLTTDFMRKRDLAPLSVLSLIICNR